MQKASKSKCGSTSHHLLKEKTKNRVSDLQMMFSNLQSAKKERRTEDIATLEEQVHQMLREWNSELSEASPASSLHVCSLDVAVILVNHNYYPFYSFLFMGI